MAFNISKRKNLVAFMFILLLYLPPINNIRYTVLVFFVSLPLLLFENKHKFMRKLTLFIMAFLLPINLMKSFLDPSFFRNGLIFSVYMPLIISCGFVLGWEVGCFRNKATMSIINFSILLQAIVGIIMFHIRNVGTFFHNIYSSEKYVNLILYFTIPRVSGTLGNANYYGFFLAISLIFMYYNTSKKIMPMLIIFALLIYAIFASRSRTAILFLIIFIITYFILKSYTKTKITHKNLPSKLLIICFFLILILLFVFHGFHIFNWVSILLSRGRFSYDYKSWGEVFEKRFDVWARADIDIEKTSSLLFGKTKSTKVIVDNLYIMLLLRYGLIGTFFIMLFFIIVFLSKKYCTNYMSLAIKYSMFLAFIVSGVVADYFWNPFFTPLYMFIFGATLASVDAKVKIHQKKEKR